MQITHERSSKYIVAVKRLMNERGHATNNELLDALKIDYPDLSATTIHRITARLHERGELLLAPSGSAHVLRYDNNTVPHDHFMCESCGIVRDADLSSLLRPQIENAIGEGCSISGSLTVSGICKGCKKEEL